MNKFLTIWNLVFGILNLSIFMNRWMTGGKFLWMSLLVGILCCVYVVFEINKK